MVDHEAEEFLMEPNASDLALGAAILKSLSQSRFLPLAEAQSRRERVAELYDAWVAKIMERYSYKSKRAMFKNMKNCGIYLVEGQIRICPMRHDKLEGWEGLEKSEDVFVPTDAPLEEIGVALRLALSRCL